MTKHAIERAKERSGAELTRDDIDAIRAKIQSGNCVIRGHRDVGTVYLVEYAGTILMPLMTPEGHIVTFIASDSAAWRTRTYRKVAKQYNLDKRPYRRDKSWRSED